MHVGLRMLRRPADINDGLDVPSDEVLTALALGHDGLELVDRVERALLAPPSCRVAEGCQVLVALQQIVPHRECSLQEGLRDGLTCASELDVRRVVVGELLDRELRALLLLEDGLGVHDLEHALDGVARNRCRLRRGGLTQVDAACKGRAAARLVKLELHGRSQDCGAPALELVVAAALVDKLL
eukprot:10966097-Alexandrium_andersonii.AAC.1